jgi:hypothetical protein
MIMNIFPIQSANINGTPFHICVPKDEYIKAKMSSLQPESLHFYPMTSAESPQLSASEIAEIEESEREFSSKNSQIYNNVTDLINALHLERSRCKGENTK